MRYYLNLFIVFLIMWGCQAQEQTNNDLKSMRGPVPVEIKIIADSLRTHYAEVHTTVKKGTALQHVMQATLQLGFADPASKFVNSIAGLTADPQKKEFWFLEINGEGSKVGLAEITIEDSMRVVWQLRNY